MNKTILFLFTFLFAAQGFSQFDKEKFEEIFEKETTDDKYNSRDNHSSKYLHKPTQHLPSWFYSPPISNNNSIIAMGISDPGLDSADAMKMAIYRAEIMANILRKSTSQLLCDFFLNDKTNSQQIVYEHFSRIITKMPDSVQGLNVVNSFRTEYDETIVLIRYQPLDKVSHLKLNTVFFELYKNETQNSIYGNYESIYELLVKKSNVNSSVPMFYQLTEYGPRNDVIGAIDTLEYKVPIYSLIYASDSAKNISFSHGLWKEYFKATTNHILNVARKKPENIKVMGDKYQTDSYEKLTRGLSVNKMRFVYEGIKIENNILSVKLKEITLD